jgi:hypothetical protein
MGTPGRRFQQVLGRTCASRCPALTHQYVNPKPQTAGIPVATLMLLLKNRDRLQEPRTTATYGFLYHQFKCYLLPPASRMSTPAA